MEQGLYKPKSLKEGDKVGIITTARSIQEEDIRGALETLRSWGLVPVLGKSIGPVNHQFGGTDLLRRADFQEMLDNQEIKAIIGARGGYGTVRILDGLDFSVFMKDPKWICGFSDMTILHNHLQNALGVRSLHSPMLSTFSKTETQALDSFRRLLFGEEVHYPMSNHALNRSGRVEGILVGGNLSLIQSFLSGPSPFLTDSRILFLEDLDEYLYHVDRMLMSLKRSNRLSRLAGIVIGGFTDMKDNEVPFGQSAEEIILNHINPSIPVLAGFSSGHVYTNYTLELGGVYRLNVSDEKGLLERVNY